MRAVIKSGLRGDDEARESRECRVRHLEQQRLGDRAE